MKKTHYFIAVPLADEVKEKLVQWKNEVAPHFPFRTWVHQEDYHITLAFLGEASSSQRQAVCEAMAMIGKNHAPFSLTLEGIRFFGNSSAPRILWQGVKREEALFALQRDVYEACVRIGFRLDVRPFTPHITIARKWEGEKRFRLEEMRNIVEGSFDVHEIVLYQTHLDRVPKYEVIASVSLSK
ncbi:2'-5' RNA ligase [Anoxybacillus tepidamans]|uniref:RNA 2',3'-cyclic phosphodiesterase n=1 Tax=Anoxybacteroides tepidamans TaxID=265948 RepID=A0A7W8IPN7_9BACL|nr:RNA 2',3'-cyclic phosphodiesterase [Anoxybacillus tepidamans]MBB5324443.1 2'-5' RNA ligase [Anoxybacillus tepidamans]